jgi:diacylglycerol kinase (ATP)
LKKSISFIINPISGGINKESFPSFIENAIDKNKFDVEIHFTKSKEHNSELAQNIVQQKKDVIVAVGGDGTINHVAKHLVSSESIFGIIPMGSGNGLARHLGISLNHHKALKVINELHTLKIDTGKTNDVFFINVAGAGFDAHVSNMFAKATKRGFSSYAKITLNEFARYTSRYYELIIDGRKIKQKAFIVCIANGSQYGNNAFIAPQAVLSDGIFEISLLKPFHPIQIPLIGFDMFAKKFDRSNFVKTYRGKNIIIKRPNSEVVNIDGEPVMMEKDLQINILPSSLKVIVPSDKYNKKINQIN